MWQDKLVQCDILRYGHIGTLNRGVGMGPQGFINPGAGAGHLSHGTLGRQQPKPVQPTYSTYDHYLLSMRHPGRLPMPSV